MYENKETSLQRIRDRKTLFTAYNTVNDELLDVVAFTFMGQQGVISRNLYLALIEHDAIGFKNEQTTNP